jgi:predicted chitinase
MWFFKTRVIDRLSNLNVEDVTQLINGGDNGIEDRRAKFNNAMEEIVC